MSRPIFVLLHGAWHSPRFWDRLIASLHQLGHSAIAPALPSSGSASGFEQDVQHIRETVSELVKEHRVVVVMHSFSGFTGGTALEGLDAETCASKGLKGGVIRLLYIAAFLVPEGFQHSPVGTRDNMIEEMRTDFEAGIITINPEDVKRIFYQDVEDYLVNDLAQDLRPQSLAAFWGTTSHAAWRHIQTTYILCLKDMPTTIMAARYLIDSAKTGSHKIDNVIEVDAGHSPFLSMPRWLAQTLVEEARR